MRFRPISAFDLSAFLHALAEEPEQSRGAAPSQRPTLWELMSQIPFPNTAGFCPFEPASAGGTATPSGTACEADERRQLERQLAEARARSNGQGPRVACSPTNIVQCPPPPPPPTSVAPVVSRPVKPAPPPPPPPPRQRTPVTYTGSVTVQDSWKDVRIHDGKGNDNYVLRGDHNRFTVTGDSKVNRFTVGGTNNEATIYNLGKDDAVTLDGGKASWTRIGAGKEGHGSYVIYQNPKTNTLAKLVTDHPEWSLSTLESHVK